MRRPKKSKYKSVVIKKKRYYFYEITWIDPTGDSGHATHHDSYGLVPSTMITHAYLFDRNKKYIWREGYSLISLVSVILFSFSSLSRFISASRSLMSVALIFTL